MSVTHDYECAAHGVFESKTGRCPYGCSKRFVQQVFLKPVGTRSHGTKRADRELNLLAKSYNMTDIKNGKNGESVMQATGHGHFGSGDPRGSSWMEVPHAKPGFAMRNERPATFDPRTLGGDGKGSLDVKSLGLKKPAPLYVGRAKE
jgi:hypothetical protein